MTNTYKTSHGDEYDWNLVGKRSGKTDYSLFILRSRLLVSSIIDSLNRGSLDWNDERAWSDLEMGYNEIKGEK